MNSRKHSFRTALLALVLGSLALTVGAIAVVAFINSRNSVEELRERQYELTSLLMSAEVSRLLAVAPKLLQVQAALVERGVLRLDDLDRLGVSFAETLRVEPELSWLSYGSATTGQFVGAWRDEDGTIVVNRSDPAVAEGRPWEFALAEDGTRTPLGRSLAVGYDPRERPWFQRALAASEPVWSEVYLFNEGDAGLTVSLAVRSAETNEVAGVLTADYTLATISQFLTSLAGDTSRVLILVAPDGQVLGSASPVAGEGGINATLAAIPVALEDLPPGEPRGFTFRYDGTPMIGVAQRSEAVPGFSCVAVLAADEREFFGSVRRNAQSTVTLGLGALGCAAVISFLLAGRLARPLALISEDLTKIARFELEKLAQAPSFVREIAIVGDSVERMKAGLRSFSRYVPTTLVRNLLSQGMEAELGAVERELTIVFADLSGFTALSEKLSPTETVDEMSEFFQLATEAVESQRGTLDKFLGDGLLAFFNAPLDVPDHAERACVAALTLRDRLSAAEPARTAAGRPLLRARIGINTGNVLVGNIGTEERFAYTVIGDNANLAARLESLNKQYGTLILAADSVRVATGDRFAWRKLDRVAVVGRGEPTTVYELLGEAGAVDAGRMALCASYEAAMELYYGGKFSEAEGAFLTAASAFGGDPACAAMAERCRELIADPPDAWDGVFIAQRK